jgi:hypothetical protein
MDPLTLFPPYGIDQTIHVAVLIGVLLLLGLTEWFGWVFSGLVVPGYLASLLVLEPASGCAVLIEAMLTFLLARLLSSVASRSGAWNAFFGRERFMLLVFVSIVVRQACSLWLFPDSMRVFDEMFGTSYRFELSLSSVGLVLVPLTANMFWKLDLRRGFFQVAVPTAITYAVLAYVLLPYTNLSFSRLELTYENVALDFLSSPKAYILLLTGAYLGSRYNLLYGWDYAGVLVPALLALGWLAPHRLATTLVETLMLVLVMRVLIRAPGFRTMNLEGPRKVALVFGVSFVLKWLIGWFAGPEVFGLPVTDLFGLGYLLSSLLAVKILQKDTTPRIIMPVFVVSLATIIIGSVMGFGLGKIAPAPPPAALIEPAIAASAPTTQLARTAMGTLALGHVRARLDRGTHVPIERAPAELERYRALWTSIDGWLATGDRGDVDARATALGLVLSPIEQLGGRDAWALVEREERLTAQVGWDTAVLVPKAPGPVIAAPSPAREAPSAEAAAVLCERVACRAVIASGVDMDTRPAHAIARKALRGAVFEVRIDPALARGRTLFHVATEAPDVNVSALWPTGLELSWKGAAGRASVLRANPQDLWAVIRTPAPAITRGVSLEAWYARQQTHAGDPARIGTAVPSHSELRFLETVVARAALSGDLDRANVMSRLVGYELSILADGLGPNTSLWVVAEPQPRTLGWGSLVGRMDETTPLTIEAPRPRRETGTGRLAVELFRHANAATLILADPDVPADRADADPASPWNTATAFQAFHQATHDLRRGIRNASILQIRGFGVTQAVSEPIVLMFSRSQPAPATIPPALVTALVDDKLGPLGALGALRLDDGAPELVDLAGTGNPQLQYCARYEAAVCGLLWFSEAARETYRDADRERELAKLVRVGIAPTAKTSMLLDGLTPGAVSDAVRARFTELAAIAEAYAAERNIHVLRRIPPGVLRAGYSDELGRPFLLVEVADGDQIMRGLVPIPGGDERIDQAHAAHLAALLARRPKIVTAAGRRTP